MNDVMQDSMPFNTSLAEKRSRILENCRLKNKDYALATVHRAEHTDYHEQLRSIFHVLENIAKDGLPLIIPLYCDERKPP